ncbi:procathepsin L-like isoform X2 [Ochlerotatus camptorhynchus]|uniref:procathepsin L-like isoform X2 n=1 Tax=Ochlerotatus camptorhynchus TaxID=644619 RepID=UPI0031D8A495
MIKCLLWILTVQIALVAVAADLEDRVNPDNITNFDTFLGTFNKRYKARYRMDRRKRAFKTNVKEIEEHNKIYKEGQSTFVMGVNEFADMDRTTYLKKMTRMKPQVDHRRMNVKFNDDMLKATRNMPEAMLGASATGMPDSLDWRDKGFKTETVNQKTCGSCYAFSISYAIDAQIMRRINRIEYVSQQQMVDCSTSTGNQGCAGGSLRYTLQYLQSSGGCMRESDYPYTSSYAADQHILIPRENN